MSNFGLSNIISIAAPILNVLYPLLIVFVVMSFFDRKVVNDHITGRSHYFFAVIQKPGPQIRTAKIRPALRLRADHSGADERI